MNAAVVIQNEDLPGTLCLVSSDFINYLPDPGCEWQIVRSRDRNGAPAFRNYHDHGQLQPGQQAPDRAAHNSATVFPTTGFAAGMTCNITETVTPSGEYRSDMHCR